MSWRDILPLLPAWAYEALPHLVGVLALLIIVNRILAQLQTPLMRSALAEARKAGASVAQALKKGLTLPSPHPRLELVALVASSVSCYLLAFYFFALSAVAMFMSASAQNVEFWRPVAGLLFSAVMLLITRYQYAEAERQRFAAIEKWRSIRGQK